jgi:hypothetical protein
MIDRDNLGRHLIVKKGNEITNLTEASESNITDEEVIYNAVGYSIFEELNSKNIVFEGWRDKKLFKVAMDKLPKNYSKLKKNFEKVGLCHAQGVKDIGRVTLMLDLASRKWVILSDSDKPAREHKRSYEGDGPWHCYDLLANCKAVTGEDFVKQVAFEPLLKKLNDRFPSLPRISATSLVNDGKISQIRRHLAKNGISQDLIESAVKDLKEELFRSLDQKHIEARYYDLLVALAAELAKL